MSVSYPALTNQISGNTAGATAFISSGTMVLAGGNNVTLSQNANSITISAGAGGAGSLNISAGTTSQNLTNVVFSNSNGLSFGLNGSTVTASHNGLTSQSNQAVSALGGSSTFQTLNFRNANGISFSNSGGSIQASYTVPTQTIPNQVWSAAGNLIVGYDATTNFTNNEIFVQGLGDAAIGFDSAGLNISVIAPVINPATFYAGTEFLELNNTALSFVDGGGISFGMTAGVVTATVQTNYLTSQSNQAFSASGGSSTFQTLNFRNTNGITFSNSGGSIQASYTVPTVPAQTAFVFSNSNGVSFGTNGSTVTATVATNYLTSQSNQALSGSNGSFAFQTATFGNLNGLSFYTSNGSMVGSYTVPTQTNQTLGLYAVSNTTLSTSGTVDARTLSFQGAGVASVGVSNGSVVISVPAGGGGLTNINVSAGTTSNNLSNIVYSNANGVTFGLNGSTVTASVNAGAGGGYAIQDFENMDRLSMNLISNVTATRLTQRPIFFPISIGGSLTQNVMQIEVSRATNGSNAFTCQAALYTFVNSGQISRLASLQNIFSNTDTGSVSGIRRLQLTGWETAGTNLTPGHYIAMLYFSATATASMNYSLRGALTANPPLGIIGAGTNNATTATSALVSTVGLGRFRGLYSTTTASPPASVNFADVQQWTTGANPYVYLGRT